LTLIRLFPTFEILEGLTKDEQSWVIAKEYGICNGWRVNFAIDTAGRSVGETGASVDVSTELDRLLLGKLRSLSDVIVTSGQTARAEKYRSSKHAPIAIFTSSGDLDDVPAIQGTHYFTPLVLAPVPRAKEVESRLADVDVRIIPFEHSSAASGWTKAVARALQRDGFQSPILESGLSTLNSFIATEVVDEICLSITSQTGSGLSARDFDLSYLNEIFDGFHGFFLTHLFTDGQAAFSRWRRGSNASQH
jgi:riboflavin biosynthesis pyrimidine reductase